MVCRHICVSQVHILINFRKTTQITAIHICIGAPGYGHLPLLSPHLKKCKASPKVSDIRQPRGQNYPRFHEPIMSIDSYFLCDNLIPRTATSSLSRNPRVKRSNPLMITLLSPPILYKFNNLLDTFPVPPQAHRDFCKIPQNIMCTCIW